MAFDRDNQQEYGSASVVNFYVNESDLQPAEEVILKRLLLEMPDFRMLDIGVGGGRTTLHFGPWASQYVGVDYAPAMIEACKVRLQAFPRSYQFQVCDARNMSEFADASFDFVLFSFNGIDHVTDTDRWQIIAEMRRVCRVGGYVAFSSHNLNRIAKWQRPGWHVSPLKMARALYGWFQVNLVMNRPGDLRHDQSTTHLIVNNGIHDGKLKLYYGNPVWTVSKLGKLFRNVDVLDLPHGKLLADEQALRACSDPWVHFLCQV